MIGVLIIIALPFALLQYFLCRSKWGCWILPVLLIVFLYWQFGMPHPESLCGVGGGVALVFFMGGGVGTPAGWIIGFNHHSLEK